MVPAEDLLPIEVVETGYTILSDDPSGSIAYAAILRNPNTDWAFQRAQVLVDLLDAKGGFLAGADVVVTLLPGQTSAIAGQISGGGGAASLDVRPPEDSAAFVTRAATDEGFEVLDVATAQEGGGWLTTGTLVSRFAARQSFVEVIAVQRDAAGVLLGGANGGVEAIEPGASVPFEVLDDAPYAAIGRTDVYWQLTR